MSAVIKQLKSLRFEPLSHRERGRGEGSAGPDRWSLARLEIHAVTQPSSVPPCASVRDICIEKTEWRTHKVGHLLPRGEGKRRENGA